ncbi:excisionase family DNA-binding protein [Arhodomonas sp. AD133]|uniref:excisionase family DNA-binding protein n=1 Tax=Arhodomonas sp. AD133 TaxID=3415009 RepID=UPI003EBE8E20
MTVRDASERDYPGAPGAARRAATEAAKQHAGILQHGKGGYPHSPSPREALARRLEALVAGASDDVVARALAEDDIGTVTTLAIEETFARELTAVEKSRLRGVQFRKDLLERAGGTLSVDEAAKLLGVTPESVRKASRSGSLIAIRSGKRFLLPAVQFHEGQELKGLRRVLRALSVDSPWMRLNWLLSPEPRLDNRRPVDALLQGDIDEVREAATLYGEQGAA